MPPNCADAKENGIEGILLDPGKDGQNTSNTTSHGDNVNDPSPEVGCAFIHDSARGAVALNGWFDEFHLQACGGMAEARPSA